MKLKKLTIMIMALLSMLTAQPTATELLEAVTEIMNPKHSKGIMKQTILTTTGDERVLTYESYSGFSGEYSLMRYLSPSRVKGNAVLTTDYSDNIWMYNNRTRRVRKLASHAKKQKFEGSDFTYEDMGGGDIWLENFDPEITGTTKIDGIECYKLVLNPNDSYDGNYSKMIVFPRTSDAYPLQVNYYEEGNHIKSCFLEDIKTIEGVPTAMKIIMKNHIDQTQTSMEYQKVTYDVDFDRQFFSERNLKQ